MAKQARPNMQDVFNELVKAQDIRTVTTALNKIDLLKVKDKKAILNKLEETMMDEFIETAPSLLDVQAGLFLHGLEDIAETFFGTGMGHQNEEEKELLESFQAALLVTNKIVEEKKDKAEPVLRDLIENISKLSDREYNDLATMMTSMARTVEPYKNKKNPNPFRK